MNTKHVAFMRHYGVIQAGLLSLFFLPVFFLLSGHIFHDTTLFYDSGGKLLLLPLPVGSVVCFIIIAILLRLDVSTFSVGFLFAVFMMLCFSVLISIDSVSKASLSYFILLMQFVLPIFALVLGSLYRKPESEYLRYEALLLYVLVLIVPLEVVATWLQGTGLLTPDLYIFSLYQQLQYLPVIFVSFYLLAVSALYKQRYLRFICVALAPVMGVYVSASLSLSAMLLLLIGGVACAIYLIKITDARYVLSILLALVISFCAHILLMSSDDAIPDNLSAVPQYIVDVQELSETAPVRDVPVNSSISTYLTNTLSSRVPYWDFYLNAVFDNPAKFVFGHEKRPDRTRYPSAYNYYLDLVYHFGILALLPFLYLVGYTINIARNKAAEKRVDGGLFMLGLVMIFIVFIENNLNVGFRQPYPGMMMFFLWGVLLEQISKSSSE